MPYILRERVEKELDRLLSEGIIEPVQFSDWAAPTVPIVKEDGRIRICGDYRVTINHLSKLDSYPIPKASDLFAALAGGKSFSKLDLSHAYLQLVLDEESRKFTTINTQKGLFQYKRLPFGILSAPAIFQRTMDSLLQGIPQTCVYLDDILITGNTVEEHLKNLDEVLRRLQTAGLRLKSSKCLFMAPSVEYLGHVIDSAGLYPTKAKVKAITEAPTPRNVTELRSFLGLINYYGKFLPNLSSTLAPLYKLLQQNTQWQWCDQQVTAFNAAKEALQSSTLLVHYDGSKPLTLKHCERLLPWIQSISNHLWWAAQTCNGDAQLLTEKWTSIIYHISNVHEWDGGEGSVFNKCVHPTLPPEEQRSKKWLRSRSLVHTTLKNITKLCCGTLKC